MTAHLFNASQTEWQPHPTVRGIRIKSLENSRTFAEASLTLVEVAPGGEIEPHLHETNFETAYIIAGEGLLILPEGDVALRAGDGVTVPPRTLHALRNIGSRPIEILAVHIPPLM